MSSAENEASPIPMSGVMAMHHEFASVLSELASITPRQEHVLNSDGVPQVDNDGKPDVQTVNPLMDLLRKKGIKALVPRLIRAITGDIIPAISRTIMATGAGMADLDARIEAMEAHPLLQIAAMEDFSDPSRLDAFLATVAEIVSEQVNLLDPEDERMERNEWILKMVERMRLGLSLEGEDEGEDEDEDEEDEEENDNDGGIEPLEASSDSDNGRTAATGSGNETGNETVKKTTEASAPTGV